MKICNHCGKNEDTHVGVAKICFGGPGTTYTPQSQPEVQQGERKPEWRCFHCDEVFTGKEQAQLHFGSSECSTPACFIDAKRLRELEAQLSSYRNEDTELHREFHRLQTEHTTALMREEEKGYAMGLKDYTTLETKHSSLKTQLEAVIGELEDRALIMAKETEYKAEIELCSAANRIRELLKGLE